MEKVLVLVASETNLPIIKAAKEVGCWVITCDNNKNNIGHKFADENLFVDVYDYSLILKKLQDIKINAVASFASKHGLKTAAIISEKYNLNGFTVNSLKTLTDKGLFRDFQNKNNLDCPKYQCVKEIKQIHFTELDYPLIIKPADNSGSRGVKKINSKMDLIDYFPIAKILSSTGNVIVEEFIEGEALINGDCLIQNREIIASIIGNYVFDQEVSEVLPIATIFPAKHNSNIVTEQLDRIIKFLNIPNGIINFEAIIKGDKTYVIEINPKPSGNYLWKLMGYYYDFDVPKYLINLYLGKIKKHKGGLTPNGKKYAYQLFYSAGSKTFEGVNLSEDLKKLILDFHIFKKPGDQVNPFSNLDDRVGVALIELKDENEKKLYLENINTFKI